MYKLHIQAAQLIETINRRIELRIPAIHNKAEDLEVTFVDQDQATITSNSSRQTSNSELQNISVQSAACSIGTINMNTDNNSTDSEGDLAENPRIQFAEFTPLDTDLARGKPEADQPVPSLEPSDAEDDEFLIIDDIEDPYERYDNQERRRQKAKRQHSDTYDIVDDDPDARGIRPIYTASIQVV